MELSLFRCYTGTILHLFICYIDDCIGAASFSHEEFEQFINFTNTFHSNLKFTWIISDTSLSFLDLSGSISGDRLEADIYFKPTDSRSYQDTIPSHPPSCKNVIPYSQFLCLRSICSQDGVFRSHKSQMSSYFKDHNFPPLVIETTLNRISCCFLFISMATEEVAVVAARRKALSLSRLRAARSRYQSLHISDDVFGESGGDSSSDDNPFYSTSAGSSQSDCGGGEEEGDVMLREAGTGGRRPDITGQPSSESGDGEESAAGWTERLKDVVFPPHVESA
eukprot:g46045.t1